jgi:type 1 glutamine amidotransferase
MLLCSVWASVVWAQTPIRVLILSGRNNHDWKATTPVLKQIYQDSGRFSVDVTEEPAKCTAQTLAKYDVVVSNWCAWPDVTGRQWGASAEKAFVEFVRRGKGFVLFHAASATFHDWPEYQQMVGATWDLGKTGHGAQHSFKVTISDSNHPVTRGLSEFWIRDELWHQMSRQPGIKVLCEAFSAKDKGGSGQTEPVVISTEFGKGRCFYNVLGHDANTMQNVAWQTLMLRGTEWAATGKVTIAVPGNWPSTPAAAEAVRPAQTQGQYKFSWQRTDNSLALLNGDKIVWRFNFDKKLSKPYFHPIGLPDGTELTWDRPADHVWHHGLWFSWKFINGVNYWEEDPKTGLAQGLTELADVRVEPHDDFSAEITVSLSYHPPAKPMVLAEKRVINVGSPDEKGRYRIDWVSRFTTGGQDVLLDRTPIVGEKEGVSWGGYAGLSVRIAKDVSGWQVINSEGRRNLDGHGKGAQWMDFSGRTADGKEVGIAMFDHPYNVRHPSLWFVIVDPAVPFGYFGPAILFDKPMTLAANKTMTLRYRILVHPGGGSKEILDAEWKDFAVKADLAAAQVSNKAGSDLGNRAIADTKRPRLMGDYATDEAVFERLNRLSDMSKLTPQTTFGQAMEMFRNATYPPLNVVVLWKDLYENANVDRQTPINMDGVSGVALGTVLKLLLKSVSDGTVEIDYTVRDGVIIIGTKDALPSKWETRVYDIRDLL